MDRQALLYSEENLYSFPLKRLLFNFQDIFQHTVARWESKTINISQRTPEKDILTVDSLKSDQTTYEINYG